MVNLKRSKHFQELTNFMKGKIVEMKKIGTTHNDKEFKALAMGIEEAFEGPDLNDFYHSFHFSKAVNAVIHRKEVNPLSLIASRIRTELTIKYKPEFLSQTERVAVELTFALINFYNLGKYTEWVQRLFEYANEEAFA